MAPWVEAAPDLQAFIQETICLGTDFHTALFTTLGKRETTRSNSGIIVGERSPTLKKTAVEGAEIRSVAPVQRAWSRGLDFTKPTWRVLVRHEPGVNLFGLNHQCPKCGGDLQYRTRTQAPSEGHLKCERCRIRSDIFKAPDGARVPRDARLFFWMWPLTPQNWERGGWTAVNSQSGFPSHVLSW